MEKRNPAEVLRLVKDEGIEIVDVRFVDLPGLMQHFSVPAHALTADVFEEGFGFDGSSIRGFQEIQESDMLLMPDPNTAVIDPFREHKTLNLNCFVRDPITLEPYSRDPRYVAQKAEAYLPTTGLADTCYFGPEAEFFIFDDVRYSQDQRSAFYQVDSVEGNWNTGGRRGAQPGLQDPAQGGLLPGAAGRPLPGPAVGDDPRPWSGWASRSRSSTTRWPPAGQAEIDMRFDTLLVMADKLMLYKYVVKNVARRRRLHGHLHAQAAVPGQRVGDALPPVAVEGRRAAVLRRRLRRPVGHGPVVHRRTAEARPGRAGLRRPDHQLATSGWSPATRRR